MTRTNVKTDAADLKRSFGRLCVECNEAGADIDTEPHPREIVLSVGRFEAPLCIECALRIMCQLEVELDLLNPSYFAAFYDDYLVAAQKLLDYLKRRAEL